MPIVDVDVASCFFVFGFDNRRSRFCSCSAEKDPEQFTPQRTHVLLT